MAKIIKFPHTSNGAADSIHQRVKSGEVALSILQLSPLESAYMVGYLDAKSGLQSAASTCVEYHTLLQRITRRNRNG